jgi:hypothetical protein
MSEQFKLTPLPSPSKNTQRSLVRMHRRYFVTDTTINEYGNPELTLVFYANDKGDITDPKPIVKARNFGRGDVIKQMLGIESSRFVQDPDAQSDIESEEEEERRTANYLDVGAQDTPMTPSMRANLDAEREKGFKERQSAGKFLEIDHRLRIGQMIDEGTLGKMPVQQMPQDAASIVDILAGTWATHWIDAYDTDAVDQDMCTQEEWVTYVRQTAITLAESMLETLQGFDVHMDDIALGGEAVDDEVSWPPPANIRN